MIEPVGSIGPCREDWTDCALFRSSSERVSETYPWIPTVEMDEMLGSFWMDRKANVRSIRWCVGIPRKRLGEIPARSDERGWLVHRIRGKLEAIVSRLRRTQSLSREFHRWTSKNIHKTSMDRLPRWVQSDCRSGRTVSFQVWQNVCERLMSPLDKFWSHFCGS